MKKIILVLLAIIVIVPSIVVADDNQPDPGSECFKDGHKISCLGSPYANCYGVIYIDPNSPDSFWFSVRFEIGPELYGKIESAKGVSIVKRQDRYSILVWKSRAFTWDEVKSNILELLTCNRN